MSLINREDLLKTLGITDMDCEKCGWYSRTARRCKRGSDFEDACCAIDDAPEVLPEPKWIPCSNVPDTDRTVPGRRWGVMRIFYGILAGVLWSVVMMYLVGQGMEMPNNQIQILSTAIIIAGAMAGGD